MPKDVGYYKSPAKKHDFLNKKFSEVARKPSKSAKKPKK